MAKLACLIKSQKRITMAEEKNQMMMTTVRMQQGVLKDSVSKSSTSIQISMISSIVVRTKNPVQRTPSMGSLFVAVPIAKER